MAFDIPPDAPPDVGHLADAVEAIEARHPVPDFALEEVLHLIANCVPRVAAELRRRRALRLVYELARRGEYSSVRSLAAVVAREVGVATETVRSWVRQYRGLHP